MDVIIMMKPLNQNRMKTAINSLIETLLPFIDRTKVSDTFLHTIIEVHLAMEKEQIIDAYYEGKGNGMDISHPLSSAKEISAEQYYNETFKSK